MPLESLQLRGREGGGMVSRQILVQYWRAASGGIDARIGTKRVLQIAQKLPGRGSQKFAAGSSGWRGEG